MRKALKKLLLPLVTWLSNKYASKPNKERIHKALSELQQHIISNPGKKGPIIPFDSSHSFVVFSDQHKGAKNGADDFAYAEKNYLTALDYYHHAGFHLINLGDSEELWENMLASVKKHNEPSFEKERLFIAQKAFIKVFGNHDLNWDNDPLAQLQIEGIFGEKIPIYEGVLLHTTVNNKALQIFLTHGHQGDEMSDGNALSKWFVANVWAPLQSFLDIHPNTPAYDDNLKTEHNRLMYEWSAQQPNVLLITGHTHQPVFESLTHLERLYKKLSIARQIKDEKEVKQLEEQIKQRRRTGETIPDFTAYQPCYFNTGCCCFGDGDITGIEITKGMIRLVKWEYEGEVSKRILLEEMSLDNLIDAITIPSS
jgi:predicted phosphodiesterase